MNKAQECLIRYLRISGMTIAQIAEILEMLWEEESTLEMLEYLTRYPTLDHKMLLDKAEEIANRYKVRGVKL